MSDAGPNAGSGSQSLVSRLGRWWRQNPDRQWIVWVAGWLLVVVVAFGVLGLFESGSKPSDTIAMPASSKELQRQNYKDVVTRLKAAGFASIETTSVDDLVLGWFKKDGQVKTVSVNGTTDFDAGSEFPKGAKIVITYHTFPEKEPEKAVASADASETSKEPEKAAESDPVESETPESPTQAPDDSVLTPQTNSDLKALLKARNPSDAQVQAFVDKYFLRTIEFDGYTWDWGQVEGYDTIYHTVIYIGNVKNANSYEGGPKFRVKRYQWPSFTPAINRMNVHVKATVHGYDTERQFIDISLESIEAR